MEEETLDVVDEKDQFIRKTTRKEVTEKVLLHRVSRVIIYDESGKILVQKRSRDKKTFPSHWDIGVAETVQSGEGYEGAAMRGLNEELGILGVSNIQLIHSFLFKIRFESQETREHCKVYKIQYNGDINFQKEEIEETDFLTTSEINDIILKNSFHHIYKKMINQKPKKILVFGSWEYKTTCGGKKQN